MNTLYSLTSIGNILIGLMLLAGGYMAFRSGRGRQSGNIQSQAIDALTAELEVMKGRLDRMEKDNTRLEQTISLIKSALSHQGMVITIDGDLVTIRDTRSGNIQAGRVPDDK